MNTDGYIFYLGVLTFIVPVLVVAAVLLYKGKVKPIEGAELPQFVYCV